MFFYLFLQNFLLPFSTCTHTHTGNTRSGTPLLYICLVVFQAWPANSINSWQIRFKGIHSGSSYPLISTSQEKARERERKPHNVEQSVFHFEGWTTWNERSGRASGSMTGSVFLSFFLFLLIKDVEGWLLLFLRTLWEAESLCLGNNCVGKALKIAQGHTAISKSHNENRKAFCLCCPRTFFFFLKSTLHWGRGRRGGICVFRAIRGGMVRCSQAHLGTSGLDCAQWDGVTGWLAEC